MAFIVTISLFLCLLCSTVTGKDEESVLIELLNDHETQTRYSVTKSVRAQQSSPTEEALKHRLEMSTEYFYIPERSSSRQQHSTPSNILLITAPSTTNLSTSSSPPAIELLRKEQWTLPILIISICAMLLMFAFEIFVLCKASRTTPSRRHLFLGQMLLLGLFLCSALAALITLQPTPITCATIRFGIGVSYALVFAALLVKCVFLISLNSGVYLPAPYQGLLLLFAVLIQITIGIQWLINTPPIIQVLNLTKNPMYQTSQSSSTIRHRFLVTAARDVTSERTNIQTNEEVLITLCQTPYMDILISLIYVIFLIIFVAILAIKSRGIRDNYRESTYIGLAVGFTIPIWLMWSLSGLIIVERYRDASLACGLLGTSLVIFLVMFLPKGRQLAAMGKEGVYVEDREDRFSSLSRAGSGYSPSFFHFKPMKYNGMLNGIGATTMNGNNNNITTMTNNSHKRHPTTVTTLGGGKICYLPNASDNCTIREFNYRNYNKYCIYYNHQFFQSSVYKNHY